MVISIFPCSELGQWLIKLSIGFSSTQLWLNFLVFAYNEWFLPILVFGLKIPDERLATMLILIALVWVNIWSLLLFGLFGISASSVLSFIAHEVPDLLILENLDDLQSISWWLILFGGLFTFIWLVSNLWWHTMVLLKLWLILLELLVNSFRVEPYLLLMLVFLVLSIDSDGCFRLLRIILFCLLDLSEILLELWVSFDRPSLKLVLFSIILFGCFQNDLKSLLT